MPRSTWRVRKESGRTTAELLQQLAPLVGRQASVVFDLGTFEALDDPVALLTFCGRHLPRVLCAFDAGEATAHPLSREDFELRLLMEGASFRALEHGDGEFRAYELAFTRVALTGTLA
ncbi:MAG: hypothetical protein V3W41_06095 [Planctomycetota bacterium]